MQMSESLIQRFSSVQNKGSDDEVKLLCLKVLGDGVVLEVEHLEIRIRISREVALGACKE
jgi:hypothetical protein